MSIYSNCSMGSDSESSLSLEKTRLLRVQPSGTHKIHYNALSDYDFMLKTSKPIDISLALPHYRARNQPVDHRLAMFISTETSPIKLKVVSVTSSLAAPCLNIFSQSQCRAIPRCKFFLDIRTTASNVTVWLPSDFRGHIRCSGTPSFSAGFVNRMIANVRVNEAMSMDDNWDGDEVWVDTCGLVTFRMWDVHTNAPESQPKETLKRIFGSSSKKLPQRNFNWDFLLED
ncbi:uncharacterized protein HD556DRAFT_666591 [Suillus plorans]|uniref:Uncharacterized protein n=1 Tax=Suillus plorans TaxID=116603 RepID=A0A9P7DEG1_9AGAM|nr:uncharacterized protein HD556DRAFT_666591 [Suillus plorans]KAG1790878.1 hypothetical protein HD556DRAFT_666591 [Suillus plorans]